MTKTTSEKSKSLIVCLAKNSDKSDSEGIMELEKLSAFSLSVDESWSAVLKAFLGVAK